MYIFSFIDSGRVQDSQDSDPDYSSEDEKFTYGRRKSSKQSKYARKKHMTNHLLQERERTLPFGLKTLSNGNQYVPGNKAKQLSQANLELLQGISVRSIKRDVATNNNLELLMRLRQAGTSVNPAPFNKSMIQARINSATPKLKGAPPNRNRKIINKKIINDQGIKPVIKISPSVEVKYTRTPEQEKALQLHRKLSAAPLVSSNAKTSYGPHAGPSGTSIVLGKHLVNARGDLGQNVGQGIRNLCMQKPFGSKTFPAGAFAAGKMQGFGGGKIKPKLTGKNVIGSLYKRTNAAPIAVPIEDLFEADAQLEAIKHLLEPKVHTSKNKKKVLIPGEQSSDNNSDTNQGEQAKSTMSSPASNNSKSDNDQSKKTSELDSSVDAETVVHQTTSLVNTSSDNSGTDASLNSSMDNLSNNNTSENSDNNFSSCAEESVNKTVIENGAYRNGDASSQSESVTGSLPNQNSLTELSGGENLTNPTRTNNINEQNVPSNMIQNSPNASNCSLPCDKMSDSIYRNDSPKNMTSFDNKNSKAATPTNNLVQSSRGTADSRNKIMEIASNTPAHSPSFQQSAAGSFMSSHDLSSNRLSLLNSESLRASQLQQQQQNLLMANSLYERYNLSVNDNSPSNIASQMSAQSNLYSHSNISHMSALSNLSTHSNAALSHMSSHSNASHSNIGASHLPAHLYSSSYGLQHSANQLLPSLSGHHSLLPPPAHLHLYDPQLLQNLNPNSYQS